MKTVTVNADDPTESKRKRERFRQAFGSRWRDVRGRNREWVMNRETLQTGRIQSEYRRFFERMATDKLLSDTSERRVASGGHWSASHITTAYDKGLKLARADMRALGASDEVVRLATNRADDEHRKRLEQEYEKIYYTTDDHITYAVSKVTDVLREAIENDRSRTSFVEASNQVIRSNVANRYRTAANTAITRAVNEALVTSFQIAGVTEVGVAVEELAGNVAVRTNMVRVNAAGDLAFETAGDQNVCADCMALAGQTVEISEVRNNPQFQPPILPGCRCRLVATKMKIGDETIEAPRDGPVLRSDE